MRTTPNLILLSVASIAGILSLTFASPETPQSKPKKVEAEEVTVPDLSGIYECKGKEASSGKNYRGICTIERKSAVYAVTWMVSGNAYAGIGLTSYREGVQVLSVSWALPTEKGVLRGINTYYVNKGEKGPSLFGSWATMPGNGQRNSESLTFLKELVGEDD